ncbi:MAG: FAD-binding protein [Chloroflexi bacterium]|nr:FAD-binding protein [Chloroflexota bacterium]
MRIAICIKQVPDLEALEFDPVTKTVKREGVMNLVNTYEKHALSAAKQLVEQAGEGEITVITMGPPQAKDALRELLAAGADRAVHLNDRAFAGSDTLATSRALSAAIRQGGYDLVFCGKYSLDAETGQVGPELAEMLDLPQVTNARRVQLAGDGLLSVTRMTDDGTEELRLPLPALITVPEDVAPMARPNRQGRETLDSKPYEAVTAADLGLDPATLGLKGSPTWVQEITTVENKRSVRMVPAEDLAAAARELAGLLVEQEGLFAGWKGGVEAPAPAPAHRDITSDRAVWVTAELYGGKLRPVTLELLGEAVGLAARLKSEVGVLLMGEGVSGYAEELGRYGADVVYVADDPRLAHYDTELYGGILADAIERLHPYAVLLPSTANGRDWAPRVAARLQLGLTGDCIGFELNDDDLLVQLKPAFGGNIVAPILSKTLPQMATVRPGVLQPLHPNPARKARVERLTIEHLPPSRVEWLSAEPSVGAAGIELESAETVVGVGFGLGGPDKLPLVNDFAAVLGASVAATRKIVDLGWLPRQQQVGLTGKVISPRLYFAVGVRGFFNHTIGIQKAYTVVAINRDPEAAIFQVANYGVAADALEFLPLLTQELRGAKAKAGKS